MGVVVLGACQKFPQPARSPTPAKPPRSGAAASNNRAHFPIFIAAPSLALTGQSRSPGSDLKGTASARAVSLHCYWTRAGVQRPKRRDARDGNSLSATLAGADFVLRDIHRLRCSKG